MIENSKKLLLLLAIPNNIYHIINYARKIKIKANSFRKGTDFVPAVYFCVHSYHHKTLVV